MRRPMPARDPHQVHRVATPLELLFDLCFVVAIAQGAAGLHHGIAEGHGGEAILGYAMVFFAIWWAWMQFTWFASAYDPDDTPYRLLGLLQIVGVLVIAAGIPRAFAARDFAVMTVGYVIMRIAMVSLWLRAAAEPDGRRTAFRYASGIVVCQLGWLGILFLPAHVRMLAWPPLVLAEAAVPVWAERAGETTWHPHHIVERYSLFTLIVLGESVAAATVAIQSALDTGHAGAPLIGVIAGAPLIFFSMWWIYFAHANHLRAHTNCSSFSWGYGHYLVFASAAAVGAGLAVAVDAAIGHAAIGGYTVSAAVAVPVAVYLIAVWGVHRAGRHPSLLIAAVLVLAAAALPWSVPVIGGVLVGLTAFTVVKASRDRVTSAESIAEPME